MALVGIVGSSGDGKSTSIFPNSEIGIEGLDPKETVIINVMGKPLPVRGAYKLYDPEKKITEGGNYIETEDPDIILKIMDYVIENRKEIKNLVIDDYGLLMANYIMNRAKEKSFDKWTDIAEKMWKTINKARKARKDLDIFGIFHQEKGSDAKLKIKTAGQFLDNQVYLDSLFTIILYTKPVLEDFKTGKMKYQFMTQTDGESTCKSPAGMFADKYICNDLGIVKKTIYKYYNE
jgi:hypothetical protein